VSPNQLAPGRYTLNKYSAAILDQGYDVEWLFGHGPGFSNMAAESISSLRHLHNDWFKLLIDYGLVGTILIVWGMVLVYARCAGGIALLAYFSFIMVTDNPLVYFYVHFVSFMLLRVYVTANETANREKRPRVKRH
jgi:O-antigen ligase